MTPLLALEFLKAIAAPLAAVCCVYLAARMGVRGFRRQKLLERRLDLYDSLVKHFNEVEREVRWAVREPESVEQRARAGAAISAAMTLSISVQMYLDRTGSDALDVWGAAMKGLDFSKPETADFVTDATVRAVIDVRHELRRDLGLPNFSLVQILRGIRLMRALRRNAGDGT